MNGLRILIVDDSLTMRAMIEGILDQQLNLNVVGLASSVEQARQIIAAEAPDVITLDLAMPGIDGLTFLEELGEHRVASVIVISSSTTQGAPETQAAMTRGAAACFDKKRLIPEAARLIQVIKRCAVEHQRNRLTQVEISAGTKAMRYAA